EVTVEANARAAAVFDLLRTYCQQTDSPMQVGNSLVNEPLLMIAIACMALPFSSRDKQIILEASDLSTRLAMLESLLEATMQQPIPATTAPVQ
ncbi:MAG: LON peptidase substrate-binding domain-containing protein, partial [Alphaproteobacteria bacterium]|nr:LON peptidase substrate-binding domain-containing protein [Alphaproteobacteria bacterium]